MIRTWCPKTDAHRLQAGLGLASLLMGADLTARRSTIPASDVVAAIDGVSISAPGHWSAPLAQRVFNGGHQGVVVTYEDGTAFHLVPSKLGSWRATDALFVGPETEGSCPGWTEQDAEQVFAVAHPKMAAARLAEPSGRRADYWTAEPTVLERAMPALAKARPDSLVVPRTQRFTELARLALGPLAMDLVFADLQDGGPAVAAVDVMGPGTPNVDSIALAHKLHNPQALEALAVAAQRIFPGRMGRCVLPRTDQAGFVVQAFVRLRVSDMAQSVTAHARMATVAWAREEHPELVPFLST